MTGLTQPEWDTAWQRIYDRARVLNLTPNKAIHRANALMEERHGERPERQGADT